MELALGLKITKTRDDIASISEYQLAKDKGPVFQSRETNTMFILSAYLKGYKRIDIDIKISKDGSKISISGKKPIQEMLMLGWVVHKKEVKITGFNRIFKIPDGVNLDKIKAKYDEEEWCLNIFMPKLVKGICGVRIEEVKEEESEQRGKSAQEKNETKHDLRSVGETSQKGPKEFEVQGMEGSESFMENGGVSDKMLDDGNREINRQTIQNEVESSNLGIDGNGESVMEKVGKEGHEVRKTSEQEKNIAVLVSQKLEDRSQDKDSEVQKLNESENVEKKERRVSDKKLDDASGDITGNRSQKEIEETMLRIEDAKVKDMRERDREAQFVAMKTSEIEQDVGAVTPQKIGDTSGDKDSDIPGGMKENESFMEKKEKMVSDNMLDDANGNINGEKQRGETKSNVEKMETEEIRMILRANSLTEEDTYGESKQKETGETKCETEDRVKERVEENTVERLEEMKTSELDETVSDHIPENIVGASLKEEFKESGIQQMEKTDSNEGKTDGGVSERMHFKANKETQKTIFGDTIHKDIKKPKIDTEGGDRESVREKVVKEEFDGVMTLCEEFPKQLSKGTHEETEGIDFTKLKEAKNIKEEMIKRKGKEIEYEGGDQECVREKVCKEGFDSEITLCAEFPKQLTKSTHEDREGMDFTKLQESKDFKEEMVKRKGKEIEYFVQKGEGERPKEKPEEAMHEEIEKSQNGTKHSVQQVLENTGRGRFDGSNSVTEELPKEVGEQDGSKGLKVAKRDELIEVIKEAMAETETSMEKLEGEASKKRTDEASWVIEKSTGTETLQKETEDSKIERKARDKPHAGGFVVKDPMTQRKEKGQHDLQEEMIKGRFQASKAAKEEFPTKIVDSIEYTREGLEDTKIGEAKDVKEELAKKKSVEKIENTDYVKEEGAENESLMEHVEGKASKMRTEEASLVIEKSTLTEETEDSKIKRKARDKPHAGALVVKDPVTLRKGQHGLQDNMSKGRFPGSKAAKEKFPTKIAESPENTREGLQDTKIEESKEGIAKQKSVEKMEKTDYVKEEGAEIEKLVKKVREKKYEKVQVEEDGCLRKDIIRENSHEETQEPKVVSKEKNQHCLYEEIGKGRYEASSTARKFPMQVADSLGKTREGSKDKGIEESEEVKGDEAKIMSGETEVFGSTTKKKIEETQSGRTAQTLQEAPEDKHPKAVEKRTPERDSQSAKVEGKGLKEVEQGSAQDKRQKTMLLPPTIQSNETHESKTDQSASQGTLQPKKSKHVGERQYTNDKEITKEVATIEDQVDKPSSVSWFPSTQQSQVDEKDKLYEAKAKYKASKESQKEDLTKEMQNLIEMKENQECKQKETLKPKNPLEKHYKKGEVITKDEFHKRQKERETMQEETAEPKIDDRDQQYVPMDFGKVVVKVLTIENEMLEKEYVADASPIAEPERMEIKRDLSAPLERDDNTTENVIDGKPKIQEEILKADNEKVDKTKCIPESMKTSQEKELHMNSEAFEKEAESSLPSVESVGVEEAVPKNQIEELQQKELSPLTAEMRSKEPLELEKPVIEWKFPKTKGDGPLPESRERERYGYSSEDTKTAKEEMPKKVQQYVPIDFGKVVVKVLTIENEMPKKEYTQAEPERMETKSDLKATFERDEHTVENVIDEKPRIQDEILKADTEKVDKAKCIPESMESTQEKEHYRKSEVFEKEAESLEAISSLPSVESVGGEEVVRKNEIEEIQQKELSPLTAEMKSNEPQELEKQTREWKFPKTNGDVPLPESSERERYGYGSEDMKAPKITAYQEELLKQEHGKETVLERREGSKLATREEAKEASRQLLKGESGKTTQTAEEKKPKMKEITPEFEKASGLKQVAEKMHETGKREHQSEKVTTKMGPDPPTPIEITRNKEVERKEPRELSRPSIENEIPMTKEPLQEKEEERLIHALELEATTSKEEGPAQATKKLSNVESQAEPKFDIYKRKESIQSTEGSTASEVVADKVAQPSKFLSSSCTQQQFELEEKDKKDADHEVGNQGSHETKDFKIDVQESTRIETEQEVDKIENLQPQSPADQQCIINKDQEQKHEIEEEKAYEQRDEVCEEDFQVLEEQKECKEEASGGKKETKWSQKLFVPLALAGTALLVSLVFVFVRHRKARKR